LLEEAGERGWYGSLAAAVTCARTASRYQFGGGVQDYLPTVISVITANCGRNPTH
jgi:hypothetical protein